MASSSSDTSEAVECAKNCAWQLVVFLLLLWILSVLVSVCVRMVYYRKVQFDYVGMKWKLIQLGLVSHLT
jgi:hypothetical protein